MDTNRIRQCLRDFDFKRLFIEELGWDSHSATLDVPLDKYHFELTAVAQKRGMAVFTYIPSTNGHFPDYQTRRKIERQIAKSHHEHLIIYADADKTTQVWQWVKREAGRPVACREHTYHHNQSGALLIQKLQAIAFSLEEEEALTLPDVTGRVRTGFDVERVTRRFYDRFKTEHDNFLGFLEGIPDESKQRWYASVMLNRLMFIYFIQKKGFLNGNSNYLPDKLGIVKSLGRDRYYRDFLCPLFFEGFAKKESERPDAINRLLGMVPYLNGGLFLKHQIEELHGQKIQIADAAFEKLFDFFEQYQWHLDERPLRQDNEINPDVLGYIFEKYINQKQMGAYYTKEDITGYISRNTIIPFLFDNARQKCRIAFEGEHSIWRLLQIDPDRYIYPAVKHGIVQHDIVKHTVVGGVLNPAPTRQLPPEIAAGVTDVSKRTEWNKPAPPEYGLPTETWREVVARRQRYAEIHEKLMSGQIKDINDLITCNLDICQFAEDVIENCEGPELLRAFWHAIESVTILDPTCGSGAFLFAALNIMESLYEACLDRMQAFLDELERSGERHRPEKFSDFRKILERVEGHPSRKYFVFKSIVINNLFGVDIMDEAVEICRLRLFLKLVAQVERVEDIEPLPDIDFNIRAGNTLVGFTTYDEVKRVVTKESSGQRKMQFDNPMQRIDEKAQEVDRLFTLFRQQQTELGGEVTTADKQELKKRLKVLEEKLNRYLASEYGISQNNFKSKQSYEKKFSEWLTSHKPFHWFIEFHAIMKNGGFDVIIGNPPYVEYIKVKKDYTVLGYETENCGNLYAFIIERNSALLHNNGRTGMIVPHSSICTDRMESLQHLFTYEPLKMWISTYCIRPAKLFVGVDQRLAIYVSQKKAQISTIFSSCYHRWNEEFRPYLFPLIEYVDVSIMQFQNSLPKAQSILEQHIWNKLKLFNTVSTFLSNHGKHSVYFHNAPRYWIRAMDFAPYFWNERDGEQISTQVKLMFVSNKLESSVVVATLNSSLFYWWFLILSDCRHLNLREIDNFPIGLDRMSDSVKQELSQLSKRLMDDLKQHKQRKECQYKATGKVIYDEFYPKYSKPIIDEIDHVLAKHYGFTDEELDFIINYDIKYRMGRDSQEENE